MTEAGDPERDAAGDEGILAEDILNSNLQD
jgi:hypothetical protein